MNIFGWSITMTMIIAFVITIYFLITEKHNKDDDDISPNDGLAMPVDKFSIL